MYPLKTYETKEYIKFKYIFNDYDDTMIPILHILIYK